MELDSDMLIYIYYSFMGRSFSNYVKLIAV